MADGDQQAEAALRAVQSSIFPNAVAYTCLLHRIYKKIMVEEKLTLLKSQCPEVMAIFHMFIQVFFALSSRPL